MNRSTFVFTFSAITLAIALPSHAAEVFEESFNFATLDRRLEISTTSDAYDVQRISANAWQISKQEGTTDGSAEIKTRFRIGGNFNAVLRLDRRFMGTGEVGLRIGEPGTLPYTELYLQELDEVRSIIYVPGGHGISGFDTPDQLVTLRIARNNDRLSYFHNGRLFSLADMPGEFPVSIFLRPYAGNGQFDPFVGQPDAHRAALDQFTLTAEAFVPEPSSAAITFLASCFVTLLNCRRRPYR
jgi:hypothetical protein